MTRRYGDAMRDRPPFKHPWGAVALGLVGVALGAGLLLISSGSGSGWRGGSPVAVGWVTIIVSLAFAGLGLATVSSNRRKR